MNYPIHIAENLSTSELFIDFCRAMQKRLVIITDSNLADNHGKFLQEVLLKENLSADLFSFPAGEHNKTRETKQRLEDELLEKNYNRDTCIIALGGGVVLDLVGFLAATFCRGVPVIYVPTTLLAMVDASIGGKTAVNTQYGKNLIGVFQQPYAVFMDIYFLKTLSKKEFANGMAEVIKHALIADENLFYALQNNSFELSDLIQQSCLIKKSIVGQDEKEQGVRQLLNFGHTIGHAIEVMENYTISHGEAVAIGILIECHLSVLQGTFPQEKIKLIEKTLKQFGLSLQTNAFDDKEKFYAALTRDKKNKNSVPHFVMLNDIGKPFVANNNFTVPLSSELFEVLNFPYFRMSCANLNC